MKVATLRQEITPYGKYFPCYLSGHAIRKDNAIGIMDRLYTTCIVIDFDTTKMVLVSIELIGIDRDFSDDIRHKVAEKYNIEYNQVYICYVHTHSAPEYRKVNYFGGTGAVEGYVDYVKEVVLDTIDKTINSEFKQVQAYANMVEIDDCYGNRNGKDKPCDKQVVTIEFKDGDTTVAGICNFTCHSTVLGPQNLQVSSDLAGYVARSCFAKWNVYPCVVIGAAGDMSNRLYRQGNDFNELNRVGSLMMHQVFNDSYNPQLINITAPKVYEYNFKETYIPDLAKKQKQYDDIKAKIDNAKTYDEIKVYTSSLAKAEQGLKCEPYTLDMQCYYVNCGDLRFFVLPCELFSRFGLAIKQTMNGKCNFIMGYCNYSCGYLGNIDDYGASFETAASDIPVGTTERIVEQIIQLIEKVNKGE